MTLSIGRHDSVDSLTTDACSVVPREFNSYGSRRGNGAVMLRAMFAHSRLHNKLTSKAGPHTLHVPSRTVVRHLFVSQQQSGIQL